MQSLIYLKNLFFSLSNAEEIPIDFIQSAIIRITIDLDQTNMSSNVSDLELASYKCESEIMGRLH